eukprot:scaffold91986_cov64-Cyclotella_meneghiniana.AAC.1
MDILNDVMWSGLECFASKGLHRLDFECKKGRKVQLLTQLIKAELVTARVSTDWILSLNKVKKFSCSANSQLNKAELVTGWTLTSETLLLDCPNVSL